LELPPPMPAPATPLAPPEPTPVRVVVYVAGAVRRPGVVALPEGARVADAVAAAGGPADDADQARLNLAAPVTDGSMLWVPAEGEEAAGSPPPMPPEPRSIVSADSPEASGALAEVNVNTASAAELEALPGIGPSLAERIVAFRDAQGPFGAAEDLLAVPGIGPRTLARFADMVRVR